ncbi:unnamed protein product [Adineta steineri]|uniref:Uncharacterized protein n=1 Tax=Adineta steineri TaxID=433720 RepID=A0A813NJS9_9BILA|nr:unnamed protein product [Adineta steineri]
MANNESVDRIRDVTEEADKTNPNVSLIWSFDDETDKVQFIAQSEEILTVDVPSYDFTKPIERFDTDISYDNVQVFFQDIGFNNITIDRLKPYFSTLQDFVDYDIFGIIKRLEIDLLANEDSTNKLSIKSQQDFFQVLCMFGFRDEWAQTYTWAMGKAYADQLVKTSIEECIRLRLSPSNTIQPFPDWMTGIGNNQWQTYNNSEFRDGNNFFIRKQTRQNPSDFYDNLNEIDFNSLTNRTRPNNVRPQYWFHATDWNSAENILRTGAERRGENTDFSKGPAYYVNNDYRDCYEFLSRRNHKFKGQHAIFIYEFDPEFLSNGRYICIDEETPANVKKWGEVVFSCINKKQKKEVNDIHGCDCVFGWQCANPNDGNLQRANKSTPHIRVRQYDGQYATQLAIRTNRMLTKVDDHLIGVVIFQQL